LKVHSNAYAERWIRSVKSECLDHLILFGQRSLAYVLQQYLAPFQGERNHQGLDNLIPFPDERLAQKTGSVTKAERLGGLFQFYYRQAA
jgi:putative transposase